jgi:hypothetical protein
MANPEVFYTAPVIFTGFKNKPNLSYTVKIGFVPETGLYLAVREEDPLFCFSGDNLQEVKLKSRAALDFYAEHGLQEAIERN